MSADHHSFADAEARAFAWLRDHRHQLATKLEEAMSHLTDLIDSGRKLAAERVELIADRDAHKDRADKAEAHAEDLQAKIDADDKAAADADSDLRAEIAKEAGLGAKAAADAPSPAVAPAVQAIVAETGAEQTHVEAAVQAHADAIAAGQSADAAHAEAINAASSAGADGPTAAAIADSVATQPAPESPAIPTMIG